MKQKKLQLWLPLMLSITMIIGMVIGYKLREDTTGANQFLSNYKNGTLNQILEIINKNYVDNINTDSLQTKSVNYLLAQLDPHSTYIPANLLATVNDESKGIFTGIGIGFELINDTVYITNISKDAPADKAGIQVGDKFLSFNDSVKLSGSNKSDSGLVTLLGQLKNPIKILIERNGKLITATVDKSIVPIRSIDAAYMLNAGTAYIRLNTFSETTYKEFMYAMEKLKREGMQQLVIDLRGNGGGVLSSATEIANEFLKDGQLIVYTSGAKVGKTEYRCKRDGLYTNLKLDVLIDETSASASEVLAGALQDWDRATIIGRRSFGKGLVENQFNLNNGAALRLTVARYYTPLGRNIQKPYNEGKAKYNQELATRFHNGETFLGDTSNPLGKQFKTPDGHIVYGGGGITPDVYVPYDTSVLPKPAAALYLKGTLTRFSFLYYLNHKNDLNKFTNAVDVNKYLATDNTVWQSLETFANKDSINVSTLSTAAKNDVLEKFRAFVAKTMFGSEGYFEINNNDDDMIKAVLNPVNKQ